MQFELHNDMRYSVVTDGNGCQPLIFSPAVDFERCAFAFDARIAPACGWRFGPMPNADAFCPLHSRGP